MFKGLKILFCEHRELTFLTVQTQNGEQCTLAFCCECGVLRQYEKFEKIDLQYRKKEKIENTFKSTQYRGLMKKALLFLMSNLNLCKRHNSEI
jgi:hypothetical protein